MPIYEYLCPQCNGRFQKLVSGFSDPPGLHCPRCNSAHVTRAVSRVAVLKSEEARAESLADTSMLAGLDESDPASVARWARKLGKQLGEDAGDDWEEMVDEMLEEELSDAAADGDEAEDGERPAKKPPAPDNLGWA